MVGIVRAVGYVGAVKAVGDTVAYSTLSRTRPRYPWSPPPRSDLTLLAVALSSGLSLLSVLLVGAPLMGVGVLYGNYVAA